MYMMCLQQGGTTLPALLMHSVDGTLLLAEKDSKACTSACNHILPLAGALIQQEKSPPSPAEKGQAALNKRVAVFGRSLLAAKRIVSALIKKREAEANPFIKSSTSARTAALINSLEQTLIPWADPYVLPPLCGASPWPKNATLPTGLEVAALMGQNWILSIVAGPHSESDEYLVEDLIEDTEIQTMRLVSRANILPLPIWVPPPASADALYPTDCPVLALYPQTTCFYPATVISPPDLLSGSRSYSLRFKDDDYEDGRVRPQTKCLIDVI
ncbi:uncharacterized protein MONBRDRAFT_30168 [Monosiga brevicollis MX1]|uniref:SGF29 C-terminal domain-containing protein n=1 Tax=Monosiga brevicollis TaxID=81824 RepID=A9VD72_MONBE|nr:uncharacterized protein MONBRDRAFT_30168 [Monosiga brevicollis MX1]EDQ84504.1 predicted protein [Monosiga brevicollis MX1]|eukprot:XP_001750691.1 hypothetical protein [Monosiga brevicollis MX1]